MYSVNVRENATMYGSDSDLYFILFPFISRPYIMCFTLILFYQ